MTLVSAPDRDAFGASGDETHVLLTLHDPRPGPGAIPEWSPAGGGVLGVSSGR